MGRDEDRVTAKYMCFVPLYSSLDYYVRRCPLAPSQKSLLPSKQCVTLPKEGGFCNFGSLQASSRARGRGRGRMEGGRWELLPTFPPSPPPIPEHESLLAGYLILARYRGKCVVSGTDYPGWV